MKDFLQTQVDRWPDLLTEAEKNGDVVMIDEKLKAIEQDLALHIAGQMANFKAQLYTYVEAYTTGAAQSLLIANGAGKAMETWRILADKGRSTREENVLQLRLRVVGPSRAQKLSELEAHIAAWDKERAYFEQLKPTESLTPELEKVCLSKMCPVELDRQRRPE